MNFVIWILLGGLLGWGASALMGIREKRAVVENAFIGVAGVMFAGWLLGGIIGTSVFAWGDYSTSGLLVALLGATVPLAAVQLFRIRRLRTRNLNPSESIEMKIILRAGSAFRPVLAAGLAGMLLLFAACASAPPAPDSALDAAKVAISNAERAEAGQFASVELGEARDKLASANSAVQEENMITAERFAEESRVQAELASARTAAAKAAAVNKEMERGAAALTEEMQRAGEPK